MHRPRPPVQSVPVPVALARKPPSVALAQVAGFAVAAATAALVPLFLWRMADLMDARGRWNAIGLDAGEAEAGPLELARTEFATEFALVCGLPVALLLLALCTALGLGRRRRWARILGAVWSGVMVVPLAAWAAGTLALMLTVGGGGAAVGPVDPLLLNAAASVAALIGDLLVFVLLLARAARRWAPRHRLVPAAALPPVERLYVPQR